MCEREYFENDNFIFDKFDESYIKKFHVEQLVVESLQSLEKLIKQNFIEKTDNECKIFLNKNIGKLYNELIMPNIYFLLILILSSIESGDEILFNHDIDMEKVSFILFYPFILMKSQGKERAKFEKDFKKNYSKNEIEEINMRNLFYKTKIKNIFDSNISSYNKSYSNNNIITKKQKKIEIFEIISDDKNKNKINDFSKYSENKIFGKEYYKRFLKLLNYNSNDFKEDIEISIYDNLKEENKKGKTNFLSIKELINNLINDEESKKGFLALVRQSYLLGKLRTNIVSYFLFLFLILNLQEDEYILGVFGRKKSGKSTFINKIFKECKTYNSYGNSTIGINLYTIKGTDNFAIIDTPGDTEIEEFLEEFASKGYTYSKMLIYIISEESSLDSASLRDNKKLKRILELRIKYKIPLFILLTNADTYCKKVRSENDENWEEICKNTINNNKKNLLEFIKQQIEEYKLDFKTDENEVKEDIIHICLVEPNKITDEQALKKMPKRQREKYNKADEEKKKVIMESFISGLESEYNDIKEFFEEEEMNIFNKSELIKKIKEKLPSQYHSAFNL